MPMMSKRCTEAGAFPTSGPQRDPLLDSGCCRSTEESEYLQESIMGMSTMSSCMSEPSPTLKPRSIPCRPDNGMNRLIVNRSDLEQCRQALRRVFEDCSTSDFQTISCAISCVLNSGRPLTRYELTAATNLFHLDKDWEVSIREQQWIQVNDWLRKCHPILRETPDGKIVFLHSRAMKAFLRSFRIRGLDSSHRTLGVICRNHIELDRRPMQDARNQSMRPGIRRAVQALSEYVTAFGNHHLRLASFTGMTELRPQEKSRALTRGSRSDTDEDFEVIQTRTKQLSLGAERDDWIVLDQT